MKQKQNWNRREVEALAWRAYLVGKTNYKGLNFAEWLIMELNLEDTEAGLNENRNKSRGKIDRNND